MGRSRIRRTFIIGVLAIPDPRNRKMLCGAVASDFFDFRKYSGYVPLQIGVRRPFVAFGF
jgi:hypothetical protein